MGRRQPALRILIADDHPLVLQAIRRYLNACPRFAVVGEATNGGQVVDLARALKPDLIVMDLEMPVIDGLEATVILKCEVPSAKVLFYTAHTGNEHVVRMIRCGAHGCVSKGTPPDALVRGIERVLSGEPCFEPAAALCFVREHVEHPVPEPGKTFARISKREREVLALVADGLANKEIASALGLGVRTVETHRENLKKKLGIRSTAGLTRFAILQQRDLAG